MNVSKDLYINNVLSASRLNIPWLSQDMCVFSGNVAIIGGAPSLSDYLDELRDFDGPILSTNGTHEYLLDNGIASDIYFQLDARACNDFVKNHQPDCVYMMASQCHPKSIGRVKPDVIVHVESNDFPYKKVNNIAKKMRGDFLYISGKGTVGVTSIPLAYTLGFDDIYLYGMDSSMGEAHHAYEQKQNDNDRTIVYFFAGKEFITTPEMMNQMYNIERILPLLDGCRVHCRSGGLMGEFFLTKKGQ